ncbi:MAG TPA: 7-dehydrocholesterol reductase [Rhabdochlamydiaceae bacterium]|nr:7-dehydrocholesterol reductase [Rhabdochlamydiaceae bacterium]
MPIFLLLLCPPLVILMWYTNVELDGSIQELFEIFQEDGFFATLSDVWGPIFFGTALSWAIILGFALFQIILMKVLPGKMEEGPVTPKGNVPVYKANGIFAFTLTLSLFFLFTAVFKLFPATIIYDNFGALISSLNLFAIIFCLFLYIKGRLAPSSDDSGATCNFVFDFFWGRELHPRVAGIDLKMFTNCRFGMMSWGLIILSFAAKQKELLGLSDAMIVSVLLQLIYIGKFFMWEMGYMRSMDIMHDRAGFVICWGCLVFVPGIYTSPALYLVDHPNHLGIVVSALIFSVGVLSIFINYFADLQRQKVRETDGRCTIWGKKPQMIEAHYETHKGEKKKNLLLASGWWGLSRHFHYVPELIAAFCWTLPVLFDDFLPYFYFLFLTILLFDRAYRHEQRCALKYGKHWKEYCEKVPYKVIPFIY